MSENQFQRAEDEYFRFKGQLAAGRITPEQFEAAIKNLMVQDAQGRYWTLAPDTGKWYVHDGTTWVEAQPTSPPSPSPDMSGGTGEMLAPPRQSNTALWLTCGSCALVILLGVIAVFFALSLGVVKISLSATATPTSTPTPIPPTPTFTPTRLPAPIFGAVVCSDTYDEAANKPINPSPNKIVAAGTSRIYASWPYQVPDLVTYKYTWSLNGNEVFSGQLKTTDLTGTMWVGTWNADNSRLATGPWQFELKTMDNKILLTDTCIIR